MIHQPIMKYENPWEYRLPRIYKFTPFLEPVTTKLSHTDGFLIKMVPDTSPKVTLSTTLSAKQLQLKIIQSTQLL